MRILIANRRMGPGSRQSALVIAAPLPRGPGVRALVAALLAALLVAGGCTSNKPERLVDENGNPLNSSTVMGLEPGAGETPPMYRNTQLAGHYKRVQLPTGRYGMVLCDMDMLWIPQAVVDNWDADTKLKFFQALGLTAEAWANAGAGSHSFGITRAKYDDFVHGVLTQKLMVEKTVRIEPTPSQPEPPDPR